MASAIPIYNPASPWTKAKSKQLTLYHGCTGADAANIFSSGVDLLRCAVDTDFGRGFYTTTRLQQAKQWAWVRFYDPKFTRTSGNLPVVLKFEIERHELAKLDFIAFVPGGAWHDDFWSLVQHCRQSVPAVRASPGTRAQPVVNDHQGPVQYSQGEWYDVAIGPVAAFWTQKVAMADADQISFHTQDAIDKVIQPAFTSSKVTVLPVV